MRTNYYFITYLFWQDGTVGGSASEGRMSIEAYTAEDALTQLRVNPPFGFIKVQTIRPG